MNRHWKFLIKISTLLLLIATPFVTLFLVSENTPNQYKNTFLAEFNDKYSRLNSIDKPKIVFVGGSSLPFGLRSDLLEEQFPGYKIVDFGLYATLGTKFMMDMSKSNINSGDVIVLSPEINSQTYSLYFNPTAVLQACDGFTFRYGNLSIQDNLKLFYNYFKFSFDKLGYSINNNAPDPIGIYRHDSFNEYGDIYVNRPNNIMNNGVDSTMNITTTNELLNDEFVNYVNDYARFVRSRGAKIYFNFSPCNELAIASSRKTRDEFQKSIGLKIQCDRLMNLEDCIIDYRYFYDTNFHLNSSGAIFYTSLLSKNLKMKFGTYVPPSSEEGSKDSGSDTDIVIPTPPEAPEDPVIPVEPAEKGVAFDKYKGEANVDFVDCFNYRLVGSSYQIVSVKTDYLDMENVILPSVYNGKNVTTITENAFYGCINLKNIYIGKTYKVLEEKAFNGCIALQGIYFYVLDGNALSPASSGLLDGANKSMRIYVPNGANYSTGYTWSNYSDYFSYFDVGE